MKHIFFTFLYILGPEISHARKYLVVDLDALKQIKLNTHGARRQTDYTVQQPKDLIKTVLNTLQSYDDDQLNNIFNSVKNKLPDLNIDDSTFNLAKGYLINLLSQGKDKPALQIKDIMAFVSQILDDDSYSDQINNAYLSALSYFKNDLSDSNTNDNKQKETQVRHKLGKEIMDIMNILAQSQDTYDNEKLSLRTREDEQKVGRLLDHSALRKSRDKPRFNILDQINSAVISIASFFLKPKGPSRSTNEFTNDEKDLLYKLAEKLAPPGESTDKSDMIGSLIKKFQNLGGNGDSTNWKALIGKYAGKFSNAENGGKTDWNSMLSNFLEDSKNNDSLSWLKGLLKNLASNEKAWDMLGKFTKNNKPAERGHGVHLSFR